MNEDFDQICLRMLFSGRICETMAMKSESRKSWGIAWQLRDTQHTVGWQITW